MIGEVRVVDDVPAAFAEHAAGVIASTPSSPFVLACSGGSSGAACFRALAQRDLEWSRLSLVFVDERCVPVDSPDYNAAAIAAALGERVHQVASYRPMTCEEGPEPYSAMLAAYGHIDLAQFGLGPDGHTASIFPNSTELLEPSETLVARNSDPSGRNVHDRLTLTRNGIALARAKVMTVAGADKADAFARLQAGEPLPGALADGPDTLWLVDRSAAS